LEKLTLTRVLLIFLKLGNPTYNWFYADGSQIGSREHCK